MHVKQKNEHSKSTQHLTGLSDLIEKSSYAKKIVNELFNTIFQTNYTKCVRNAQNNHKA